MANVSVTTTFTAHTKIKSADVNTNNSDLVNYINARNSGGTKWEAVATSGNLTVDGIIYAANGTSALPSLTFVNDPSTGLYDSPAGSVGLSVSGVAQVIWNGSGQIVQTGYIALQDGTVGTPGILFVNDPDTGAYRIAANNYGVAAGGVKVIDALSTGVAIRGTTTNNDAPAGFIGEYSISSVTSYANVASTGTFGNVTSLVLAAGDWDVIGHVIPKVNTAGSSNTYLMAVSAYSANTTTDHVLGYNVLNLSGVSGVESGNTAHVRMSLSTSTTIYLKASVVYGSGNPQALGTLQARRVR